jgi:hypothetical protein
MIDTIALPVSYLANESIPTRAFYAWGDGRFTESAYFPFNTETLDGLTDLPSTATEFERNIRWWTPIQFYPEAWPPELIQDYVDGALVQLSFQF